MDWRTEALKLSDTGLNAKEVLNSLINSDTDMGEFYGLTDEQQYEKMRGYIKRQRQRQRKATKNDIQESRTTSISYDKGETTFQGVIELLDGEPITPEVIMKAHNLDIDKWDVVSYKSNFWNAQMKGGQKVVMYQSKITVKPKSILIFSPQTVEEYLNNKKFNHMPPHEAFPYTDSDEHLEIDYTDAHVGLLSWRFETGADFDLKIAREMFLQSVGDVYRRCKDRQFKSLKFVTLGDIVHVDNSNQTTTNGTFQQVDGRNAKIYNYASDMLIEAMETFKALNTNVEYVYLPGNHDRDTGYHLAHGLSLAYRENSWITFDIAPNPLKIKNYGDLNVVGYCHGDMPKNNMASWLTKQFRKATAEAKFVEVHRGHIHTKSEYELEGYRIISLNSLCESSYWEHQQGYTAEKALMSFVWNENHGKRETWITNF